MEIMDYLMENKMVMLVLIALLAWGFWSLTKTPTSQLPHRGRVPQYQRYNRRAIERHDRRRYTVTARGPMERRSRPRRRDD